MPTPNGLAAATLTGNGYTLASGVYSQTFGTIVVSITLSTEVEGSGFAASVNIVPGGDITAADAASVAANLVKLGFTQFANWPAGNFSILASGGQTGYWQTV